jgi:hypothetical protein
VQPASHAKKYAGCTRPTMIQSLLLCNNAMTSLRQ